jgi:hypothetical protein
MDYHKLKLYGNENIDTVAIEYEIESELLREFHNSICTASQIIPKEIPTYIEFIYMPLETFELYLQKTIPTYQLTAPDRFDQTTYGIIYKNNTENKQIHYTIDVEKKSTDSIIVNKHKTYINNHPVEKVIEELLEKTERAIYPLHLSINPKNVISKIENDQEINNRWTNDILPAIHTYYQSKLTDEIIEKLNSFFLNPNRYFEKIFHHLFYSFYFFPIYRTYPNGKIHLPFSLFITSIKQQIHFDLNFKLHKKLTRADKIKLEIIGVETNSITSGNNKATIDFTYILHKETHKIFSIVGIIICFDENNKQHDLTFEMYELKK